MLNPGDMGSREYLDDVTIRARQLETHLLQSPEYLHRADQELKKHVSTLYLAIALLILFQGIFAWQASGQIALSITLLTTATALLAILNCLLLIRTKRFLRHLNDAWLRPDEKTAITELRHHRAEVQTYQSGLTVRPS